MKKDSLFAGFVNRLRDDKRLEIAVYALLAAVAAIIFFASGGISCDRGSSYLKDEKSAAPETVTETELERRLEEILQRIDGAGKVRVMITFDGSPTLVTAEESSRSTSQGGSTESVKPSTVTGSGSQSPIVLRQITPGIRGVVVVAEGARDIRVKTELQSAVMTVLGADASVIGVYPMEH